MSTHIASIPNTTMVSELKTHKELLIYGMCMISSQMGITENHFDHSPLKFLAFQYLSDLQHLKI